jgi:uncharacterized protein YlzI (FlbEa/FlbD family)
MSSSPANNPSKSGSGSGKGRGSGEIGPCYHCDAKSSSNTYCEIWRSWTCGSCLGKFHKVHHKSCAHEVDKKGLVSKRVQLYFTIQVTRYDGKIVPLQCRLGEKMEMEEHWMGTYIFGSGSMILVSESRAEINEKILAGLRSVR